MGDQNELKTEHWSRIRTDRINIMYSKIATKALK